MLEKLVKDTEARGEPGYGLNGSKKEEYSKNIYIYISTSIYIYIDVDIYRYIFNSIQCSKRGKRVKENKD